MSDNPPKVSVVIPAYNASLTIKSTIDSILKQTYGNLDLIIVDDGSTDDTANIVSRYLDDRVKYVRQENKGRARARNRGISVSKGDFLGFIDSDDLWLPCKLEKQVPFLRNNPDIGLVYCDLFYFDQRSGNDLFLYSDKVNLHRGENCIRSLLRDNFIQSPTPLVRRSAFEQVGLFDQSLIPVEDWDMWLRIASHYPIDYIDEPLARYRVHQKYTSWKHTPDLLYNSTIRMFDKTEKTLILEDPSLKHTLQKCRSIAHYNYATALMHNHQLEESLDYCRLAIKSYPSMIKVYVRLLQLLMERIIGQY